MKFGAQLELYSIREWADKYIRYNYLKRFIDRRRKELLASHQPPLPASFSTNKVVKRIASLSRRGSQSAVAGAITSQPSFSSSADDQSGTEGYGGVTPANLSLTADAAREAAEVTNAEFLRLLDEEIKKVKSHFLSQMAFVEDRAIGVLEELDELDKQDREAAEQLAVIHEEPTPVPLQEGRPLFSTAIPVSDNPDNTSGAPQQQQQQPAVPLLLTPRLSSSLTSFDTSSPMNMTPRTPPSYLSAAATAAVDEATGLITPRSGGGSSAASVENVAQEVEVIKKGHKVESSEARQKRKARDAHRRRLENAVISICDTCDKLEAFVNLNSLALYKILKKRDKVLGIKRIQSDLPIKRRELAMLVVHSSVKDNLFKLYRRASNNTADDLINVEFQDLSVLVQKQFARGAKSSQATSNWIMFFLGACVVLISNILLTALIPASNVGYSMGVVLTVLPIFRLAFMILLMTWGAGAVVAVFEYYGVNYKFILSIDPKCQVTSLSLLAVASLQTSLWIMCFGTFLIDIRFGVFGTHSHYWLYPIAQLGLQFLIFVLPSRRFRYEYRRNLIWVFADTIRSGFYPVRNVTLVNNIVGDILTSLAKPLCDVEFTLLYFGVGWRYPTYTGWPEVDRVAQLVLTLLPYWIRFFQCLTRYRMEPSTHSRMHLGNMGKYLATIVVILTSTVAWETLGLSIYAARLIFVFTYIFASLYNLIWDVVYDWGLLPDPDNFVRPNQRVLYPQYLYYGITLFNIIGRLTWALTLVPITILDDAKLSIALITFGISAIEILRRSAWLVLRLENEHLTNSSKYRAMLWVPNMRENDVLLAEETQLNRRRLGSAEALVKFQSLQPANHSNSSSPTRSRPSPKSRKVAGKYGRSVSMPKSAPSTPDTASNATQVFASEKMLETTPEFSIDAHSIAEEELPLAPVAATSSPVISGS